MNARLPKRRTSPNKIKAILSQATQSMMLEDPGNYLIRRAHNNAMDDDDGNHDLGQRLSRYLSEESLDLDDLERGSHSDGVGEMETNATDSEEELTCSQSI